MIDAMMNTMANFASKVSKWLTLPSIPWGQFSGYWNELIDKVAPWNRLFPLTDVMVVAGLMIAFSVALMVFYTVVLIKSFIPFSGGK
ncbi:hypothetical protein GC101_22015 [Paenibacillus sp. LMG 31459]|uniref:Uncharacterized protein n=1 Tax=Paenibacillus phytohabitans TaxID=2654978 RepID=A0ABX1YKG0_9BACL|nr:hypothetical protein [Paenibacillus phytohabitans]NOU81542.1 hypothetical protein [Paenibacillus phytohabitans]